MTQDRATDNSGERSTLHQGTLASSYYVLLGLHPSASVQEIRQAYRDLSKLYHPDTTALPPAIATSKFHELNEAYATLSSPERRVIYDRKIGYSRIPVVQPLPTLHQSTAKPRAASLSSAYLDPTDRPLSPGELFALFILGLTFIGCLVLAITIGITRGDTALEPVMIPSEPVTHLTAPHPGGTTSTTGTNPSSPVQPPAVSLPPASIRSVAPASTQPPPELPNSLPSFAESHDAPLS